MASKTSDEVVYKERDSTLIYEQEIERDLQTIFKKLRVNNKRRKTILHETTKSSNTRRTRSRTKLTHQSRKILRDPTFIFNGTKTLKKTDPLSQETDTNFEQTKAACSDTRNTSDDIISARVDNTNNVSCRVQNCGEQFRKQGSIKMMDSLNVDDTTPAELAAYFDQLLHIPKPMSQMAEMMYT